MRVREATPTDRSRARRLERAYEKLYERLDVSPGNADVPIDRRRFVAEMDGAIIGFADITLGRDGVGTIAELFVAPEHRRRGAGRRLLDAAHTWLGQHGARSIELQVFEANRDARAFYEAAGYRTATRRLVREP